MLGNSCAWRDSQKGPVMHEFAAVIALVNDHFFPHSLQIDLWCETASASADLTVGPMTRPHVHDAEYMM
jgi:hypothetical protein